ncbi:hypothetical protein INR49_024176, partial [Caranx melampygus]
MLTMHAEEDPPEICANNIISGRDASADSGLLTDSPFFKKVPAVGSCTCDEMVTVTCMQDRASDMLMFGCAPVRPAVRMRDSKQLDSRGSWNESGVARW